MNYRKKFNKYTSWRVGVNSACAALIFYAYPVPAIFVLVVLYDFYLLLFSTKYAALRFNIQRFRLKKVIVCVYGVAGFFASILSSKGDMGSATIFISLVLLVMIFDTHYHLALLPKGKKGVGQEKKKDEGSIDS